MPPDPTTPISTTEYGVPWWREPQLVKRLAISFVAVLLLSTAGYFVGYPAFKDFRRKRIIRIAKVFVDTEDYRSAYLLLDQHIKNNPTNLEARRLLAKVLEEYGAGQGLAEWENLIKVEPDNAANQIGYISSALRVGLLQKIPEALSALQKLQPNGIDFYRLSAGLALVKGDAPALRQAVEAMALAEPENVTTQFNVAALRLNSSLPAEVAAAREALEKFARGDAFRIRAALALIADAPRRWPKEKNTAKHYVLIAHQLELDKILAAAPSETIPAGAPQLLAQSQLPTPTTASGLPVLVEYLQNQPAPTAEDVTVFTQWMLKIGQAREALVWLEALPEKSRQTVAALSSMAACAVALEAWDKLESLLIQGAWGPVPTEAVKFAFQARLLRTQENESRAESIWNKAIQSAEPSLSGLRMLHRLMQLWRWPGKEIQVLWVIVRRFPNDALAWQKLADQVMAARETAQVWRFYNAWMQAAPTNLQMQCERVVIGLLARPQDPGLAAQAEQLYRTNPNHPGCRLAQALALWRGGLANEALIVLDAVQLNPATVPRVALARGLVLAAIRRSSESERMFALVKPEWLLPEENALIAAARAGQK